MRILLDREPATLNPRRTLDANGQRLGSLLYGALTRVGPNLEPVPAFAESWKTEDQGRRWVFRIRDGLTDHAGASIGARELAACLEEYRAGSPASPVAAGFPSWKSTQARERELTLSLERPDPYFARNLSLLRYFRQEGRPPCSEPENGTPVITSGDYSGPGGRIDDLHPDDKLLLIPRHAAGAGVPPLEFHFVRDETTRALMLMRGDVDVAHNALSLTKTWWFKEQEGYRVVEREGVNVTYLAFNMKDPLTAQLPVRQAVAAAIDRESATSKKYFGLATPAQSFLSPLLDESAAASLLPAPGGAKAAEAILERAGFKRDADGVRLRLNYKTTTSSIGIEQAMILRDMLARAGIELALHIVESAVFFSSIGTGNFQLYTSRWVGVADGSILHTALRTGQPRNRARYSNPRVDEWIDRGTTEPDPVKRREILAKIQKTMIEDLPYFPLWYWKNTVILRADASADSSEVLTGLNEEDLSLSGALDPLSKLRWSAP